jgi:hypothetical protein
MSAIHAAKSQIPPFKLYRTNAQLYLLTAAGVNSTNQINSGTILRDMGKKVYMPAQGSTLVKVQVVPITNSATENNNYLTGYISLGDGTLAATNVSALN